MLDRVNLQTGQTPTESDWETWFNRVIDYINAGIPVADIIKDAGGRIVVNITGDATSVGGKTVDQIVAGDFPDVKKTLIDLIGGGLVLSGGVATKSGTTPSQLDITAVTLVMKDTATGYITRVELAGASKTTLLANTTYYLDVAKDAIDYSWGTAHPAEDCVTLASVVTDASANISSVLDARPLTANLFGGTDVNLNMETPAGAQTKVDTHEAKPAPHSGHETPAGAQAKADAVQANLDAKLHQTTGHKHTGAAGDGPLINAATVGGMTPAQLIAAGTKLVGDFTVTGSAVTQFNITGLDINAAGGEYLLHYNVVSGASANLGLGVNGDVTGGDYNDGAMIGTTGVAGYVASGFYLITLAPDLIYRAIGLHSPNPGGNLGTLYSLSKKTTVANITELNVFASAAGGIGVGSKFTLLKLR